MMENSKSFDRPSRAEVGTGRAKMPATPSTFLDLFVGQRSPLSSTSDSTSAPASTLSGRVDGKPVVLRWRYEGESEEVIARHFVDAKPSKMLHVSNLDETSRQILRPSNLSGEGIIILDSGKMLVYGDAISDAPSVSNAVQAVNVTYNNNYAVLTKNNIVYAWGGSSRRLTDVAGLAATAGAIAAYKTDGGVVAWGVPDNGGNAPDLNDVVSLAPSANTFVALKGDGSISAWGFRPAPAPPVANVSSVIGNSTSFVAIKKDGSIVAWGDPASGGNAPVIRSPVVGVAATDWAFAAYREDGYVTAWGERDWGGLVRPDLDLSAVVSVKGTVASFAALNEEGRVATWGNPKYGGEMPEGLAQVSSLAATAHAFVALKHDGSVVSWGQGSDIPTDVEKELKGIKAVLCSGFLFFALREDGRVFVWGGGAKPDDQQVTEMQNNFSYFYTSVLSEG